MTKDQVIPKGMLVIYSQGEYSDYCIVTVGYAKEELRISRLKEEYKNTLENKKPKYLDSYAFANWLVNVKKAIDEINWGEVHTGSWGQLDKEAYTKVMEL